MQKEERTRFTINLSKDLALKLKDIASKNGLSRESLIRNLLINYAKTIELEEKAQLEPPP